MANKFKVGDKVRVKKGCENSCYSYVSSKGEFIKITAVYNDYYIYDILDKNGLKKNKCEVCFRDEHLEPLEKTWETLESMDEIISPQGNEHLVFLVVGGYVLRTTKNSYSLQVSREYGQVTYQSINDLKKEGWKIKGATPETIEIGGKKYKADEVAERVKELKEV